ncbi:hypothetical protein O6H91_19G026700 [Diphasiastrum complanatum]|nr:hypothetical protein O6H91_19G026700 [Diphasiastrum complanatum]
MDHKKRKVGENGAPDSCSSEGYEKLIDSFTKEQLLNIVRSAASRHSDVMEEVRKIADKDPAQRKIFVRGLGWETTTESLSDVFTKYGELDEAVVITDKNTGKSRGFGFVTYSRIDGALRALEEPSKTIDGRVTVCQLASQGTTPLQPAQDVAQRKIYVGNVPADLSADKLLALFTPYGDIAEGPLGYDKATGKSRGFSLIIYKTLEGAKKALEEPVKVIEGHQLYCKLAAEGQKQKDNADSRKTTAIQLPVPQSGAGILSGYSLPLGTVNPSMFGAGLPLHQGINQGLGYGLMPGINPVTNLSSVQSLSDLGHSLNPSLIASNYSLNPYFTASLNPSLNTSLSSLSSQSSGHGALSGLGQGLQQVQSPSGLASLGSYSEGLGSFSGQLGMYSRLGATSLYGAPTSAAVSQAGLLPGPSVASHQTAQLGASQSESAQSANTLASLRSYYGF